MRTAELSLAPEARSAGVARRFLYETLTGWGAETYGDPGALLLSELVTNAALHARTIIQVRVCLTSTGLRLEVMDGSERHPIVRHYSTQATTGRGLGMVDFLAQRWGVLPQANGKTVWAELVDNETRGRTGPEFDSTVDLDDFPDLEDEPSEPAPDDGPASVARDWAELGYAA
ncbi:MAG: ATP-binding protein [Actinomycetota bacterium]|nr:ATP-binding protein [Actinomycetota bacterium]